MARRKKDGSTGIKPASKLLAFMKKSPMPAMIFYISYRRNWCTKTKSSVSKVCK
jgi:hypothetical protein